MHKTTIYLEDELYRRVRRLAQASQKTQAAIIREAVAVFTSSKVRRSHSVGMGRSGAGDLSERADELLSGFGTDR